MTLVAVTDTETTGLAADDQICELGIALLDVRETSTRREISIVSLWTSLVKPSCAMSIGAQAVHHITPEELDGAWSVTEMMMRRGLPEFGKMSLDFSVSEAAEQFRDVGQDVVLAAHNAKFDRQMLEQSGIHPDILPARTICTYKCARHLYPSAEKFGNQSLRYELGLDPLFLCIGPPHRALPDVAVTAALLVHMLETHSVEKLVQLTTQPILIEKVAFGKYRGHRYRDLDSGMLRWITEKDFGEDEKYTAQYWLEVKTGKRQHRD